MRMRCVVFLTSLAAVLLAVATVGASAATPPPGANYAWAQPGTAVVNVPFAQPPAWIPTTATVATAPPAAPDYAWAQPGTAVVNVPFAQPPAWIPTG